MVKAASALDYIFHPRSVAVVGVSADPGNWISQAFLKNLESFSFPGAIYPVNPGAEEIRGFKVYASVRDIPEPVDLVVVTIPAPQILQVVEDCLANGVKVVYIYAAGFSESGDEAGMRLEQQALALARKGNMRVIGPNCMGIYCPTGGLTFGNDFPKEPGPVGYLSQSGGNSIHLVRLAAHRGIRFSKVVSYGNALDINETDLLEYFTHDPQTQIIAAYIEGVKDGRRFFRVLREAAQRKPLILLKGGRTEAGTRAVASHTGALAGLDALWDALLRQAGAVRVYGIEELVDTILAFYLKPFPRGRRVGVVGMGGGANVQAADDCEAAGLEVPPFPPGVREELAKIVTDPGTSYRNPIDSPSITIYPKEFSQSAKIVAACPEIDFLIAHLGIDLSPFRYDSPRLLHPLVEVIIEAGKAIPKPMAVVFHTVTSPKAYHTANEAELKCFAAGFPVFPTIGRAARAMSKAIGYYQAREVVS